MDAAFLTNLQTASGNRSWFTRIEIWAVIKAYIYDGKKALGFQHIVQEYFTPFPMTTVSFACCIIKNGLDLGKFYAETYLGKVNYARELDWLLLTPFLDIFRYFQNKFLSMQGQERGERTQQQYDKWHKKVMISYTPPQLSRNAQSITPDPAGNDCDDFDSLPSSPNTSSDESDEPEGEAKDASGEYDGADAPGVLPRGPGNADHNPEAATVPGKVLPILQDR